MSDANGMRTWKCEDPDCRNKAIGVGSPLWLLAGGWYVKRILRRSFVTLCPEHHPEGLDTAQEIAKTFKCSILKEIKEAEEDRHGR